MVSELYKFQIFHWYRWNRLKRPWWSLETLWKLGIPCLGSHLWIFCPTHVFLWHMELCLEDRVESVCFSLWGSPSVNDVFEVLKFLKWEFMSEWPRQQNIGHGPFLSRKQQAKSFWLYNFLAISIWNVFVKWIIMIHLTFLGPICSNFCSMMTKTTKCWPRSFSVTKATGKSFLIV